MPLVDIEGLSCNGPSFSMASVNLGGERGVRRAGTATPKIWGTVVGCSTNVVYFTNILGSRSRAVSP